MVMPFNLKSILNPTSGAATPQPPHESDDDTRHSSASEDDVMRVEGGESEQQAAEKMAELRLEKGTLGVTTTSTEEFTLPPMQRPTSSESNSIPLSPADSRPRAFGSGASTSPSSAQALPLFPYAAPVTSLSHEAPALQSFVPVRVDRAGKHSSSPTPQQHSHILVKREDDDDQVLPSKELSLAESATRDALMAVHNEHGLRGGSASSRKMSSSGTPQTIADMRKRPPPKKPGKKGTAKKAAGAAVKPKRKSNEAGKKPLANTTVKKAKEEDGDEEMYDDDAAIEDDDEPDDDGEDEVYCVCRKPDDHKYMIGCDGGCNEWFHGACVNITEDDGRLIDSYICEKCSAKSGGSHVTTWKPSCRFPGCGNAARTEATMGSNGKSLYCSDEHGRLFWTAMVRVQNQVTNGSRNARNGSVAKPKRPGSKAAPSQTTTTTFHTNIQRGGALPPQVLKTLVSTTTTTHDFHSLGNALSTFPPAQAIDLDNLQPEALPRTLSPEDVNELHTLAQLRHTLAARISTAQARFSLVTYATTRRDLVLAHMGAKRAAAFCGHDADTALPPALLAARMAELGIGEGVRNETLLGPDGGVIGENVCARKNCNVHPKWWDMERQDAHEEVRMWTRRLEELRGRVVEIGEAAGRRRGA